MFFYLLAALAPFCARQNAQAAEPVRARHGMVVTVEPHATEAGLSVLQHGGNAIDAAVAVGFGLAVTHPSAGNLGGGGFMLIRFADGRTTFINFRERAPLAANSAMYLDASGKPTTDSDLGYRASGVPGTPRGLELAWRKYGSKSWRELLEPAWLLASKGFIVSYDLAKQLKSAANQDRLNRFPDSKRIFLRDGRPYEPGELFKQPELAQTLKGLMKSGADDFYEGQTAHLIASDMKAHGGLIGLEDLKEYKAIERAALRGSYRGYTIITAPPPSSGGLGILQILGILEPTGVELTGAGSASTVHYMAEAMRRYFADRSRYLGDPDFVSIPIAQLLDPKYIAARRQTIDAAHATASASVAPGIITSHESRQTTHYSIVDAQGNAVGVTYTLNGSYGSGVTATGTGVLLNNEMDDFSAKPGSPNGGLMSYQGDANAIYPRKTPLSSMSPTILLHDGKLFAVLGSPGGPTIINTVVEVIVDLIDFKMNIADAVAFARFHHQWMPDRLQVERGFSPDTIEKLKALGHDVQISPPQGEVAAIVVEGGWLQGAADPRTEGTAKGY
jgi:gamma-glutamyltranspeptidase/glutathione hydrolase